MWNMNNTDRNDVNKQNTYMHNKHLQKDKYHPFLKNTPQF